MASPYLPQRARPVPGRSRRRACLVNGALLHPCAACGCRVHRSPVGSGAACPVCGWLDDYEQLVHPDLAYGANTGFSLRQAQARARAALAGSEQAVGAFERDAHWRPLHEGETPAADPQGPSSPVCFIATPDPADYVPYWKRGRRS